MTIILKAASEIRDLIAYFVRNDMGNASNRKRYRYLVQYLKKLRRYSGGRELAEKIANEWKVQYPRRSAMLDELKKAKF